MGNRLVIHNNINGKRINSLYYHWSADAISGVTELAKFLIAMYKVYNKADEKEAFIKQLNGKGKELAEKLDENQKLLAEDKELLFNLISYISMKHMSAPVTMDILLLQKLIWNVLSSGLSESWKLTGS